METKLKYMSLKLKTKMKNWGNEWFDLMFQKKTQN